MGSPQRGTLGSVAESRRTLLDEIGARPELTFVRGLGNAGDELIWEGTRRLLDGHVYREIDLEELCSAGGGTALLCGAGAFCRTYNEYMPEALAIAELRFERVIVLPSSFEVEEDRVRDALLQSRATVFARERESYLRISGLCDARLAHDCAFYFDYSSYAERPAAGTLHALRTDAERMGDGPLPEGNDDISTTCTTLEEWLEAIARHERVVTDRAHVMLAAALMGREARYAPSNYFKVPALAETLPPGARARPIEFAPRPAGEAPGAPHADTLVRIRSAALANPAPAAEPGDASAPPRVTAVIVSHDRADLVSRAVRSALASDVPAGVIVVDNNSAEPTREALRALKREHPEIDLRLANRNLGCAGGRRFGVALADAEFVLFLDDDAELMPGALEHLVADLDAHPGASAVTALVVYHDGTVYHFGGWVEESASSVTFDTDGHGRRFDDPSLADTGPSGWAPGTAVLVRAEVFDEVPIDDQMSAYYEDNDWCLRLDRARPASQRRCREAIAVHAAQDPAPGGSSFVGRAEAVRRLSAHARFLATHRKLLHTQLVELVPELARPDGSPDHAAASLLLALIDARGPAWTLMAWGEGALAPLFEAPRLREAESRLASERERVALQHERIDQQEQRIGFQQARLDELEAEIGWLRQRAETLARVEAGGWWRLRGRLAPLLVPASRLRRAVKRGGNTPP